MTTNRIWAIGYVLVVVGLVAYVNITATATVNCIVRAQSQDSTITSLRSDAAERRDDALVRSKLTMARIVELRVGGRDTDSGVLRQLTANHTPNIPDYDNQTALSIHYVKTVIDYTNAQHELDTVRDNNPPPNIRKMC